MILLPKTNILIKIFQIKTLYLQVKEIKNKESFKWYYPTSNYKKQIILKLMILKKSVKITKAKELNINIISKIEMNDLFKGKNNHKLI